VELVPAVVSLPAVAFLPAVVLLPLMPPLDEPPEPPSVGAAPPEPSSSEPQAQTLKPRTIEIVTNLKDALMPG
jgi:hypothetical protein